MSEPSSISEGALVIFDGDCIYCNQYARLLRLRDTVGPVELVDARSGDPRVARMAAMGYDLDEGMIFAWRGRIHHGAEAVQMLGALSSSATWFNRLNATIFSRPWAARLLYPAMKLGRRITLVLRGKRLIRDMRR